MGRITVGLMIICFMLGGTGYSQSRAEKKKAKAAAEAKEFEKVKDLVDAGSFRFEAQWATTQKGRRIDLISNPNYLNVSNGELDVFLPFFGEMFSGPSTLEGGGIECQGPVSDYTKEVNTKKNRIILKFKGNKSTEIFNFTLTVFANGSAGLNVSSSNRSNMSYTGNITPLKQEE